MKEKFSDLEEYLNQFGFMFNINNLEEETFKHVFEHGSSKNLGAGILLSEIEI